MRFMSSFLLMPIVAFNVKIVYYQIAAKDNCSEAVQAVLYLKNEPENVTRCLVIGQ